ncbi:MAG: preprotein translocase subunit YajC [Pseudomonadota bacterium]
MRLLRALGFRGYAPAMLGSAVLLCALVALTQPAFAQVLDDEPENRTVAVQPYIEVSQVLSAELTPGNDVLTFTQLAAGIDLSVQGRHSAGAASVRYERNIGYGDNQVDGDTINGIARGSLAIIPRNLTFEAGALASRTRVDGGGGVSTNPLVREDATSQTYSVFAGPTLQGELGDIQATGFARIGYNRFEIDNVAADVSGNPIDVFDDSVTFNAQTRLSTRANEPLPVGLGVTTGWFQEDISNLDQRVRDRFVRADVTVPITLSLALVGGIGYENVEISSRDALRDASGAPLLDQNGRFVTDPSSPRILAFDIDGLLWDVGVLWRPSSRTSLSATVGERYDSTTYYGNFTYSPDRRSSLSINVYDAVSGFGGVLNNGLFGLANNFEAVRNPVSGDFGGLVTGLDGPGLIGTLGSVRSAAFRGRGVSASYQRQLGRLNAAIAAGYDEREFIAAAGTVLAPLDGLTDQSYYVTGALNRQLGRRANLVANAYVNWFESDSANGDVTAFGASAGYNRLLTEKLSARAAVAVDYFDSEFAAEDFAFATALVGLRYDF